jgi:hypothetical protein
VADDALPFGSPRWGELAQAYGSGEDIPQLLDYLARVSDDERTGLWFGLWSTLVSEGRVYTASYAAVPHLVAFAEGRPLADRAQALHLAGTIVAAQQEPGAPPVPDDVAAGYAGALARAAALVARSVAEPWDPDVAQVLASVLAIVKGHPRFGRAALALEPVVACPVCGAPHAPPGWAP